MSVQNKTSDLKSVVEELNPKIPQDEDKLDELLSYVGEIGRYQKYLFLATLPFGFTYCFNYYVGFLITVTPQNYWCVVPELSHLHQELRRNLSAPGAITGEWNRCMTFDTNWTQILHTLKPPPDGTPLVPCQNGWEFEFSDIPYETVTTERGWVCEYASYPRIASTMFFGGSLVGCLIFGWIADRYGRIPAIVGSNLLSGVGGVLTIFTKGNWDFILCKFLVGLSFDNCYMIIYTLVLEFVGPKHRTMVANLSFTLSFGTGAIIIPYIAYFIADWRMLIWVTTLQAFFVVVIPWVLPESIKWYVSRGRVDDALTVLRKFESVNKTKIPGYVIQEFLMSCEKPEKSYPIASIFRSKLLGPCIIAVLFMYFGFGVIFDGLVRVTDIFGMDMFSLLSASAVCEFVAVGFVAFTLDRFGRRNLISVLLFTSGVFLLSCAFVPKGYTRAILSLIGRFFMNSCIASTNQWANELLPTPLRVSGFALLHSGAYVANMLTPYLSYAERIWTTLPILIFPVTAFLMTGVSLSLPETKGLAMPQTIKDSERIIRNYSLCSRLKVSQKYTSEQLERQ